MPKLTEKNADAKKIRDFENFIRGMICQGGITQKDAATKLGYDKNPQNFLNKLHRGTFRALEERELAELLGYHVAWIRENHVPLNEEILDAYLINQKDKLYMLLKDFKPIKDTLQHIQSKKTVGVKAIFLSPGEQHNLEKYWIYLGKIREIWYSIQSFFKLRYPEKEAFTRRERLIHDIADKLSLHMERDIERINFF